VEQANQAKQKAAELESKGKEEYNITKVQLVREQREKVRSSSLRSMILHECSRANAISKMYSFKNIYMTSVCARS